MKKIAFLVAAVSLFAVMPLANRFGPIASALAFVWLGILLAVAASGMLQSLAVGSGALGALASGVLAPISPTAAGAVLVAAAFAERTTRVRSRTARGVHMLLALAGGGLAGALSNAYTTASLPVFAVAAVVGAVLAALPLLVEADDPVAHALSEAAGLVSNPSVKRMLLDGAELRRTAEDVPLDRATAARVRTTWQSLLRLAEARLRLDRPRIRIADPTLEGPPAPSAADAVVDMVEQRIAEHVSVLARAYAAVDTVSAARIGLDDTALKNAASIGDSLDDVSRAIVEVR